MRFSQYAFPMLGILAPAGLAITDDSIVPGAYIVEFNGDQDASLLYDELQGDGISVTHRMDLNYQLFKGASFRIEDPSESDAIVNKIVDTAQVKNIWPVRKFQFPKPEPISVARNGTGGAFSRLMKEKRQTGAKDSFNTHVMTQVDKLRAAGFTGKGIRIGVVDTGVDYRHPALGGCFGKGCPVEYGYDLTGDDFYSGSTAPAPDPDPLDTCQGHGTHVAGIIMAHENELGFTGVAPDVTLGMYKVSGCPGYTTSEILIAAFNRAYEDGSDIISCSAGDDSGWATDPAAMAASRIAEVGVPVIVAVGNSGGLGLWTVASPASGVGVTGIGSVDNTVLPFILTKGSYNNGTGNFNFGWRAGQPAIGRTNLTLPLWAASNDTKSLSDACDPLPNDTPDLSTIIALLRISSDCSVETQATNIIAKGGRYIIFYPQAESGLTDIYVYTEGIEGTGLVTPRQGAEWIKSLAEGEEIIVTLTSTESSGLFIEDFDNGPAAGYTSSFSSWGPTWEVEVKPQFTAPGGGILSTWIWDQGEYAVHPGTSMSTPFAAAVFALVGQARGTFNVQTLRNVISATSEPKQWNDGVKAHDILAPIPQQGAGLVQAFDAAHVTTILSINGISFNDSDHFVGRHSFSIHNTGAEDVTYVLAHARAATVYTFTPGSATLNVARSPPPTAEEWAELTFDSNSVTVPAGASAKVSFTAVPPASLNSTLLPVYSGYITLNGSNGETLSLPYLGVAGSLRSTPVLRAGFDGISGTYLSSTADHFLIPVEANKTFTIPRRGSAGSAIYPKIVANPTVGSMHLRIDVVAVGGSNSSTTLPVTDWFGFPSLGQVPQTPLKYVPRTGSTFNFAGVLADRTNLPEGLYKFVVSAVRIFGDAAKKEDWDFVETVPFVLKYFP